MKIFFTTKNNKNYIKIQKENKMKINKNYFLEVGLNFFLTFLTGLGMIIINRYFSIYLGNEKLGLMKLFTQLLAYLNLAEMGVAGASAYALYRPLADNNYKEISIVMSTISKIYNKILIFILTVGILVTPIIPFFIKNKNFGFEIYYYWILYVLSTVMTYIYMKYSILFMADQKFKLVRLIQSGGKVIIQIFQIIVLSFLKSFPTFIILLIIESIIQYICYKFYYNRDYKKNIYKTKEEKKEIIKDLKNLFWHKLAGMIVFNTDLILISTFISLEVVAVYSSYLLLNQMFLTLINVFLGVLTPKIGLFVAKNTKENSYKYWKTLNLYFIFFSLFLTLLFYNLSIPFINLWMGKNYIISKLTLILIAINLFINLSRGIIDRFKDSFGFFDDVYLPISEAIINFIFSVILLFYIGLDGVILGTIISNIVVICIVRPIIVFKRCFDKNLKEYLKIYGNYLLLILFSVILTQVGLQYFNKNSLVNSWIELIKLSFVNGVITLIFVFFIFFVSNNEFRKIKNKKLFN